MSKATWDEEVEFEEPSVSDQSSDNMVLNPENEQDDKNEEEVGETREEQEEVDNSSNINEIKYKLSQYDKLRRQNFAQNQQMRKLISERNDFQNRLIQQYEDSLIHNQELLENKLGLVKAKLQVAVEQGDTSTIADANTEIASLAGEIRDISKQREEWDFTKKRNEEENKQYQEHIKENNNKNINWFYSNPEFNPQNSKYDKHLQREFINYAKEIDNELISQGQSHVIGSPEYYDYFENVMDIYRKGGGRGGEKSGEKTKTFNPVSPVSRQSTNSTSVRGKSKNSVYITSEEARINKLWGITPEEHVKFSREWKDKDFEMEY